MAGRTRVKRGNRKKTEWLLRTYIIGVTVRFNDGPFKLSDGAKLSAGINCSSTRIQYKDTVLYPHAVYSANNVPREMKMIAMCYNINTSKGGVMVGRGEWKY
jgi:hypothetical protein